KNVEVVLMLNLLGFIWKVYNDAFPRKRPPSLSCINLPHALEPGCNSLQPSSSVVPLYIWHLNTFCILTTSSSCHPYFPCVSGPCNMWPSQILEAPPLACKSRPLDPSTPKPGPAHGQLSGGLLHTPMFLTMKMTLCCCCLRTPHELL
ncbi:hypothetical protein GOP47_0011940, partial [Adiantum capillus-veneris]